MTPDSALLTDTFASPARSARCGKTRTLYGLLKHHADQEHRKEIGIWHVPLRSIPTS